MCFLRLFKNCVQWLALTRFKLFKNFLLKHKKIVVIFDQFCPNILYIKQTFPFDLSILDSAFSINGKNEIMTLEH